MYFNAIKNRGIVHHYKPYAGAVLARDTLEQSSSEEIGVKLLRDGKGVLLLCLDCFGMKLGAEKRLQYLAETGLPSKKALLQICI